MCQSVKSKPTPPKPFTMRWNCFSPLKQGGKMFLTAIPRGTIMHFWVAQRDCDVFGVTDVLGYMTLNAERHLGCPAFHIAASFISSPCFRCLLNVLVFLVKTFLIWAIYQKVLLKTNIIEMSASCKASFINLSRASMMSIQRRVQRLWWAHFPI